MLKVQQVANRLNLSVSKVYQLIERGRMPHYRLDGSIRVSEEQLAAYLESAKREAATEAPVKHRPPRYRLRHIRLH